MPNENYNLSNTQFGEEMQRRMAKRGVSIRDLADLIDTTYEYARRMARGLSIPSKVMCHALSTALEWPLDDIKRLASADKIRKDRGVVPIELAGKKPELEHFERGWDLLTRAEKDILYAQFDQFIRQHKKHAAERGVQEESV